MPLLEVNGEVGIVMFDPETDVRFSGAGKCWVKFRGKTVERKRDANGTWADGDAVFLDYVVFGRYAENFAESIVKGNTVVVKGKLAPNVWTDKEGKKVEGMRVVCDYIGPSLVWETAKTPGALGESPAAKAQDSNNAVESDPFDAPF